MATRDMRRGDRGDDVAELQNLLNQIGGMLTEDGDFGGGVLAAVKYAQRLAGRPQTGVADAALMTWLRDRQQPEPGISWESAAFIGQCEVSGCARYEEKFHRPVWPQPGSGITIGIGYDLKMQEPANFDRDWGDLAPRAVLDQLRPFLGKEGGKEAEQALSGVSIPLDAAWPCFSGRVLPRYVTQTRNAFGGARFDALAASCKGALVSLVYNRGADLSGDPRRREMVNIRDHIAAGRVDLVAREFLDMRRLWPDAKGLRDRRAAEAKLWEKGLAERQAAVPQA